MADSIRCERRFRARRSASVHLILGLACLLSVLSGCTGPVEKPGSATPTLALGTPTGPSAPTPTLTEPPTPVPTTGPTASPTPPTEPALIGAFPLPAPATPGRSPSDVVLAGGQVYVANRASDNVSVLGQAGIEAVVPVGAAPGALAADPATGRVYVLNQEDNTISVLQGHEVRDTWALPARGTALCVVGGALWVGVEEGRIAVLSSVDGAVQWWTSLSSKGDPLEMIPSPDGARGYATTYGSVHVVDAEARQEGAAFEANVYRATALSTDGGTLYIAGYDSEAKASQMTVWDTGDLSPRMRVPVAPDASALIVDPRNGRLYLLSRYTHQVTALDGGTLQVLAALEVGYQPVQGALDPETGILYVANGGADSVTLVDTAAWAVKDTVPLALRINDLEVDPDNHRLYVAASSADRVLVLDNGSLAGSWYVGRCPHELGVIPSMSWLAVASLVEEKVLLLNRDSFASDLAAREAGAGQVVTQYATGRHPVGLMVDEANHRLYVGDTEIDWTMRSVRTLQVPTIYVPDTTPPVQMVRDTRRGLLYAVASNGVPGSNHGYVVTRWGPRGPEPGQPVPGRLSVVQLLYDEALDRFYATTTRMGQHGLQVSQASDCQELFYMPLRDYATAMALNPTTHHLWVILLSNPWDQSAVSNRLVAYDTRTMEEAASFELDGVLQALAVDAERGLVYVASGDRGVVYVVQDMDTPLLTTARTLQTLPPRPTATPAPTPTCAAPVAEALWSAWQSLGGREGLGCALEPAEEGDWAVQPFEQGVLYWRGSSRALFALFEGDDGLPQRGTYLTFRDAWQEGMPEVSCDAHPPDGLYRPIRGFGLLWCREDRVGESLGWATAPERGFRGLYQTFESGALLRQPDGAIQALHRDGHWATILP